MTQNLGETNLRRRKRVGNSMYEFDHLPKQLRKWMNSAILPWSPVSVRRLWCKSINNGLSYEEALHVLDNAEAYTTKTKRKDPITGEEIAADEKFMKSIEEVIGISGSSRQGFRSDVTAYMFAKMRKGENVDYTTYKPLKEAIESYLISSVKDIARIVTKSKTRDDDQKKKYSEMMRVLIEEYDYNENSAEEVITYASNNIWRDS